MADTEALDQVTVITVTFNSAHCLPTLGAALANFSNIIIVDNGSNDDSASKSSIYLPQAHVLALPDNLGFGAANNRALAKVQTTFALLLNPDCEITPQAVHELLRTATQWPDAAMVAPQLRQPNGQADVNYRWPHLLWNSRGPAITDGPACVGFVCGAAMLLRMSAFNGQFFDERFFLYYEDDDLCTRMFNQRKAMVIAPSATAIHRSRGSVKGRNPLRSEYIRGYHHAQSKLIYASKYQSIAIARQQQRKLLWQTALALMLRVLVPSPRHVARMVGRLYGLHHFKSHDA